MDYELLMKYYFRECRKMSLFSKNIPGPILSKALAPNIEKCFMSEYTRGKIIETVVTIPDSVSDKAFDNYILWLEEQSGFPFLWDLLGMFDGMLIT